MKRHISTQESKIQLLGSTETVKNATVCRLRKTTMLRKHMPHYATHPGCRSDLGVKLLPKDSGAM